jgi:hypothetical protein
MGKPARPARVLAMMMLTLLIAFSLPLDSHARRTILLAVTWEEP